MVKGSKPFGPILPRIRDLLLCKPNMALWRKTMPKKPATKDLLHDDNVRRWYENTSRGSKLNADIRLRRLNLFCHRTSTTPVKLVRIGRKDIIKLENMLFDHVSWLELQNYAPNIYRGNNQISKVMVGIQLHRAKKKSKDCKCRNSRTNTR